MTSPSNVFQPDIPNSDIFPPLAEEWPFPLFLIDPDSETISWVNQTAQEWLGKSMRRILGKTPWTLLTIQNDVTDIISKCASYNAPSYNA